MRIKTLQITILLYLIPCSSVFSQNFVWATHTAANSVNVGYAIGVDLNGNVYSTGYMNGTVGYNLISGLTYLTSAGASDIFITKQNSSGDYIWARRIGGIGSDRANYLAVDDSGNFYIAGVFNDSMDVDPGSSAYFLHAPYTGAFICKYDSLCNLIWGRQFSGIVTGGGALASGMNVSKENEIYFTGSFIDTVDFDPDTSTYNLISANGFRNSFVLKLNSFGNLSWAKILGHGSTNCYPTALAIDSSLNVITCGKYIGSSDFDPDTSSIISPSNGSGYICKLDSSGRFIYAKFFGDSMNLFDIKSLASDRYDRIYFTGEVIDSVDIDPGAGVHLLSSARPGHPNVFICRLDPVGYFNWAELIRDSSDGDHGIAIVTDNQSLYVTGDFMGPADFNPQSGTYYLTKCGTLFDSYVLKLTLDGDFIWVKQICGTTRIQSNAITLDRSGGIYVTGYFRDSVDFDPGTSSFYLVPSYPYHDFFVLKLGLPTGITYAGEEEFRLTLFPNPSSATIRISCDKNFIRQIRIYNTLGSLVTDCEFKNAKEAEIDVSKLSGGIYIAMIQLENGWKNIKFLKD